MFCGAGITSATRSSKSETDTFPFRTCSSQYWCRQTETGFTLIVAGVGTGKATTSAASSDSSTARLSLGATHVRSHHLYAGVIPSIHTSILAYIHTGVCWFDELVWGAAMSMCRASTAMG